MIFLNSLFSLLHRHRAVLAIGLMSLASGVAISVAASHLLRLAPVAKTPQAALSKPRPPSPPPAIKPAIPAEAPSISPPPPAAPVAKSAATVPAWLHYAQPAAAGRPMIAVIIDDMGLDRRRSAQVLDLPGPLTISLMSYAGHLAELAEQAHARGDELMMHMPMQPLAADKDAGPGTLTDDLPPDQLRRRVDDNLARFQGYVGINNHMGSRFTADAAGMRVVMEELHKSGLLFIDSLTTGKSTGQAMARAVGVPNAGRDVFLDDVDEPDAIEAQLRRLEAVARRNGSAIAIGHPRDNTIAALTAWLPGLADKGLTLVPVTAVVKARQKAN